MKVLFLSPAYPPQPIVGALRSGNLAAAFARAGHQVTVLCEHLPEGPERANLRASPVRTVSLSFGLPFARRLHSLVWGSKEPLEASAVSQAEESSGALTLQRRGPAGLRALILALLSTPDGEQHIVAPLVRAGLWELRYRAELVYSTAPPFSTHLAGLILRILTGTPWVAEFRDPWNHPWSDRPSQAHPVTRGVDALLERLVLRHADAIVTVTETARNFLARRIPAGQRHKLLVARNGIPTDLYHPSEPVRSAPTAPYTILYTGSLYLGRNPIRFLEGLARFVDRKGLRPEHLQVRFIGRCSAFESQSVTEIAERLGLTGYLRIEDWKPHGEILRLCRDADLLLMFAQRQPLQVPNKLYEYLAAGTPILAFLDQDGESAHLLRGMQGTEMLFDPDVGQVSDALEHLYQYRRAPNGSSRGLRVPPAGLSTDAQLGGLVAELARRFGTRR